MFGGWGSKKPDTTLGSRAMELSGANDKNAAAGGAIGVHGFDPSSLERAAEAARSLDKSPNAARALGVIKTQEETKQKEAEADRAKWSAHQEELAIRRIHEEEQAAANTLERQSQHERQRAEYADQLERKRMVEQMNAQRHMADEERAKNEASLLRQEEIRRKTLEHEAELRQRTEAARVKAEAEGRIMQERSNHDLILEKQKAEAAELRATVLEGITLASSSIGNGVNALLEDRERLKNLAATLSMVAVGVYTAKTGAGVAGRFIESRLGKPSLVRETTRLSFGSVLKHPIASMKSVFARGNGNNVGSGVILESSLEARMRRVGIATANTKKHQAPFRHLMLHGPPGTGKTMFAKSLARSSGLDYAILTGGDVAPLGREAVTEIHKLFAWAATNRRGTLLFIDEAEAFLRKRSSPGMSEDQRNALNAFLYHTGEASRDFMVVFATNQPEQLDWAVNDRCDDLVEFQLPTFAARERMIDQYVRLYLLGEGGALGDAAAYGGGKQISLRDYSEEFVAEIARLTEGYSGREISKLVIAWQAAAYAQENAVIGRELMMSVFQEAKLTKDQKNQWMSETDAARLVQDKKH